MNTKPLANCRIFYLEDDYLIAVELGLRLEEAGAEVVLCGSVSRAMDLLPNCIFDFALLDFNIAGTSSVGVAREFKQAGVPILFLTAYARDILPSDLASCALLTKPAAWAQVLGEVQSLLNARASGEHSCCQTD